MTSTWLQEDPEGEPRSVLPVAPGQDAWFQPLMPPSQQYGQPRGQGQKIEVCRQMGKELVLLIRPKGLKYNYECHSFTQVLKSLLCAESLSPVLLIWGSIEGTGKFCPL